MIMTYWFFDMLVPLFLLLENTYTRKAFFGILKESILLASGPAFIFTISVTWPLLPFEETQENAEHLFHFIAVAYAIYSLFCFVYITCRIFFQRRRDEDGVYRSRCYCRRFWLRKPHFLVYAGPFTVLLCVIVGLEVSDNAFSAGYVSMIWGVVRIPLIYYALLIETRFWRSKDQDRRLSFDVLDELQIFLRRNQNILVDFISLLFNKEIGRGATATVYSGTMNKTTEVAIKMYVITHISYSLFTLTITQHHSGTHQKKLQCRF